MSNIPRDSKERRKGGFRDYLCEDFSGADELLR
ncbi:MAG: hypothetical protein ACJA1A_000491 [Saprospiraceae bacterium]|jgi:hypothetical protein